MSMSFVICVVSMVGISIFSSVTSGSIESRTMGYVVQVEGSFFLFRKVWFFFFFPFCQNSPHHLLSLSESVLCLQPE